MVKEKIKAKGGLPVVQGARKIRLKEVVAQQDYVYVVAYCYSKKAERHFRLDRIVKWESVPDDDSPFGIPVDHGNRNN